MKCNIIILIFVTVLFSCCNSKEKQKLSAFGSHVSQAVSNPHLMQQVPLKLIEIDTKNCIEITRAELDSCVTDLKYIYLKTEDPIGYVGKIVIRDNKIFITDRYTDKIFIFDMEGNLINIIADKGGGPHEYTRLVHADISTDEIIIYGGVMKMLYYTLEGKFIRQERGLPCKRFAVLGDKFILHVDGEPFFNGEITPHLIVAIKDSAIRGALPHYNIQNPANSGKEFEYNYRGDLLFLSILSDTVYQILTDSTYAAKYFVKHKKSIWQKRNADLNYFGALNLIKNEGYTRLEQFHETEKYVHFVIVENGGDSYWYDKESKQTYCFKGDVYNQFIPYIDDIWGNYFLACMWPERIIKIREHQEKTKGTKDTFNIKNTELRKIIEQAEEDPNQVIVLYKYDFSKLKQFGKQTNTENG